jgi:hypothetical protein
LRSWVVDFIHCYVLVSIALFFQALVLCLVLELFIVAAEWNLWAQRYENLLLIDVSVPHCLDALHGI